MKTKLVNPSARKYTCVINNNGYFVAKSNVDFSEATQFKKENKGCKIYVSSKYEENIKYLAAEREEELLRRTELKKAISLYFNEFDVNVF